MKILSGDQIRKADSSTLLEQNLTSAALMERAGTVLYRWLNDYLKHTTATIHVFCGTGNNGGDGLVVARLLSFENYNIIVHIVPTSKPTPDFKTNLERLTEAVLYPNHYDKNAALPEISPQDIVIDAIFGSGLNRQPDAGVVSLFQHINNAGATVIAIDIPSGLYLDRKPEKEEAVLCAAIVLSLQFPKLVFFLPELQRYLEKFVVLDIGLSEKYSQEVVTVFSYTDADDIQKRLKTFGRYSHKGTFGHVLTIGGSYGKIGSMILASTAALKTGCGLVTAFVPECGYEILQVAIPEVMVVTDKNKDFITDIQYELQPDAVVIGMGMGQNSTTQQALHAFLKSYKKALVIDADGLNIISENKTWLSLLPSKTILTPHPKELERLIGKWKDDFDKIDKTIAFSKKYDVVILIKGAYSMVVYDGEVHINSTGNPALSTGGSGDVLSGMIASLRAQSYDATDALILAVYLHGLTADLALADMSYHSFVASDIINYLGRAYQKIGE